MSQFAKIVVYTPESHADIIRDCLSKNGCGSIGNYDSCSFSIKGIGRFRPLKGANPHIGQVEKMEEVAEERIETICRTDQIHNVLQAIKMVHPYEEPAIDVFPLLQS